MVSAHPTNECQWQVAFSLGNFTHYPIVEPDSEELRVDAQCAYLLDLIRERTEDDVVGLRIPAGGNGDAIWPTMRSTRFRSRRSRDGGVKLRSWKYKTFGRRSST